MRIRKKRRTKFKNIDKNLDVNLPNPIAQTKNLLLKIDESVASREIFDFDIDFETFQFMNYNNKKNTLKNAPSIVFNAVKDEKLFDLVKIETEKTRKRF